MTLVIFIDTQHASPFAFPAADYRSRLALVGHRQSPIRRASTSSPSYRSLRFSRERAGKSVRSSGECNYAHDTSRYENGPRNNGCLRGSPSPAGLVPLWLLPWPLICEPFHGIAHVTSSLRAVCGSRATLPRADWRGLKEKR